MSEYKSLSEKYLELYTLEELIEMSDLTEEEVLDLLLREGFISEELIVGL